MGKASYIAIAAMTLLTASLTINATMSSMAASDAKSRDQESLQAEQIARSGLDMTVARISRDFTWRTGFPEQAYGGGSFVTAADGGATGPVRVYSAAVVEDVDMQLTAWLTRLASAPAALSIKSDTMTATIATNAIVSGVDHTVEDGEGMGRAGAAHGAWTSTAKGRDAILTALGTGAKRGNVRGVSTQADIAQSALPGEHAAMLAQAEAAATATYPSSQAFVNQTFGTTHAPAIVVIDGDASFQNGGGTGLLYVKGSFEAKGTFEWHGVVLAEDEGDMDFTMSGTSTIFGAAYILHDGGDSGSGWSPITASPLLNNYATSSKIGTHPVQTVQWTDWGTVSVRATTSGGSSNYSYGKVRGSTLQAFIQNADILGGASIGATGVTNLDYLGPTAMPVLRVEPVYSGYGSATSDIYLTLNGTLPDEPLYAYVLDIDVADMYIYAYDAAWTPLSTASWTKSQSIDLVTPDDGSRTTMTSHGTYVKLHPTGGGSDAETIIDEIMIPSPGALKHLRFRWTSPAGWPDYAGIALTDDVLFGETGVLDLNLGSTSSIRYSAQEIGRLATVMSTVDDRSWVQSYDFHATSQVDRMALPRRGTGTTASQTTTAYQYCEDGSEQQTSSLMQLLILQFDGAVPGPCGTAPGSPIVALPPVVLGNDGGTDGDGGGSAEPDEDGRYTICHKPGTNQEKTQRVKANKLDGHLDHGDNLGACPDD